MLWNYWKKFSLLEEHASYKIEYYSCLEKLATTNIPDADRQAARKQSDILMAKMYSMEQKFKEILELVPKY